MTSITRLLYISVLFLLISMITYATDHYVDKNASGGNNGTSWNDAWQSFSSINWSSIQPGDFIYISGGTDSSVYTQTLTVGANGTAGNPITITIGKYAPVSTGHSGRVIFDGGGGSMTAFQVRATGQGRKYITIKGFECRNLGKGVNIEDVASNIVVDSLYIYNYSGQGAIMLNGASSYSIDSTTIKNCRIISVQLAASQSDGVYAQRCQRTLFHNNYIHQRNQDPNAHTDCLQAYLTNGWVITNNFFINDSVYSPEGGGTPMILGSEGNNPVIIYNNFLYMGGIWDPSGSQNSSLWTRWYNNNPMPPTWVIHNTIVVNGPRCRDFIQEYDAISINNILATFSTNGGMANLEESLPHPIPVDSTRHNLFWRSWSGAGFSGQFTGNGHTGSVSGWSSWTGTYGGTGVNADPLFVHKFGFEPDQGALDGELQAGSPAINAGEDTQSLISWLNTTYNLDLPWADINGNPRDNTPTIGAYEYDAGPDITPPSVIGATLSDSVTLVVNFSEALDETTAEDENNYSITNNINVLNASLSGTKVTLQTSPHSPGSYVVTVVNVEDLAGNTIAQSNTAEYEYTYIQPDSLVKLPVQNVEGVIQEPDHTPLKTIDGMGALSGDPDSRWAAEPMPEDLIFDLGTVRTISKTRLSFYNWDSGRIYNYSVSISSDHNNWTTIIPQKTSASNEEWTIDEFSAVNARYVRVNFISNNQSTWAGLWEGEIWGTSATVIDPSENNSPNGFALSQNFPNPFNPSTTIEYTIPVSSFVTLKVYDILGNEVANLVNEYKNEGSYKVNFSTSGGATSGVDIYNLPSGIYFYRLQAGSLMDTKKMILLK